MQDIINNFGYALQVHCRLTNNICDFKETQPYLTTGVHVN
jgi:hypothetical protein